MSELVEKKGGVSSPSISQGAAPVNTPTQQQGDQESAIKTSAPVPSVRGEQPTCQALNHFVSITVGKDKKETFQVYEGLLCFYSDYFRSAFRGKFSESTTKTILLENVEIQTFKMFLGWLHFGTFSDITGNVGYHTGSAKLIMIWIFADMYLIPLLKNEAIDAMLQRWTVLNLYPFLSLHHVYDNTPKQSPIRRLLIDYVKSTSIRWSEHFADSEYKDLWPIEFLLELAVAGFTGTVGPAPIELGSFYAQRGCKYHDHASDGKTHD